MIVIFLAATCYKLNKAICCKWTKQKLLTFQKKKKKRKSSFKILLNFTIILILHTAFLLNLNKNHYDNRLTFPYALNKSKTNYRKQNAFTKLLNSAVRFNLLALWWLNFSQLQLRLDIHCTEYLPLLLHPSTLISIGYQWFFLF